MAISGRFYVSMEDVFPFGAYVVSDVEPVRDFDKSTRERRAMQITHGRPMRARNARVRPSAVDPGGGRSTWYWPVSRRFRDAGTRLRRTAEATSVSWMTKLTRRRSGGRCRGRRGTPRSLRRSPTDRAGPAR